MCHEAGVGLYSSLQILNHLFCPTPLLLLLGWFLCYWRGNWSSERVSNFKVPQTVRAGSTGGRATCRSLSLRALCAPPQVASVSQQSLLWQGLSGTVTGTVTSLWGLWTHVPASRTTHSACDVAGLGTVHPLSLGVYVGGRICKLCSCRIQSGCD